MSTASPDLRVSPIPSQWRAWVFAGKAWALRLRRVLHDLRSGRPPRHLPGFSLCNSAVLASFEGALWPQDEADQTLVAGKIHNLRLARKRLHGLEIPAQEVFSFWRQLGRAIEARGYVFGRELREGCIIPAVGGGLCQLSNAIYDSAVRAGIEIVERHRHSQVLPGSLAEIDRDATVFWNYLDLRLRAPFSWRLEIELDQATLHVRILADAPTSAHRLPVHVRARGLTPPVGDCATCDTFDCDQHTGLRQLAGHRTWVLDEALSPELESYRQGERASQDRMLGGDQVRGGTLRTFVAQLPRRLRWSWSMWRGFPIPKARAAALQNKASALANRLRSDDLHLVVAQGLLPYLWHSGELAGRKFDVLMDALPMTMIQAQLDAAKNRHPNSDTLADFRAPAWLVDAEAQALRQAQHWISAHTQVLTLAGPRGIRMPWLAPAWPQKSSASLRSDSKLNLLFPASSLARKGVLELREALQGLDVRVLLPPGASESQDVWKGICTERVVSLGAAIDVADLVVLPAWVEHQPRGLLAALERGLPVIATAACGLLPAPHWYCVPEGDVTILRATLIATIDAIRRAEQRH